MDVSLNQQLIDLTRRKKKLQAEVDGVEEELRSVREVVSRQFVDEGTQNWKGADGSMIYLRRSIYVSLRPAVDPLAVCGILKECGLEFLVKTRPDTAGLASWLKEREDESAEKVEGLESFLPERVREVVNVAEQFTPAVRGA